MQVQGNRVAFAAHVFMREMTAQWIALNASRDPSECPVRPIDSYPAAQRAALERALRKAIEAATGMEDAYMAWLQARGQGK